MEPYELQQALAQLGPAAVMVGNAFLLGGGGMGPLGATEGEVRAEVSYAENKLTAEQTAGQVHQTRVNVDNAVIVAPMVLEQDAWLKISPTGTSGGGHSRFQRPVERTVCIIPMDELGGGLSYGPPAGGGPARWERLEGDGVPAAVGAEAAPKLAFWLWRAYVVHGNIPYRFTEGGKGSNEVRFQGMHFAQNPEGHKLYTLGDPVEHGIVGLAI